MDRAAQDFRTRAQRAVRDLGRARRRRASRKMSLTARVPHAGGYDVAAARCGQKSEGLRVGAAASRGRPTASFITFPTSMRPMRGGSTTRSDPVGLRMTEKLSGGCRCQTKRAPDTPSTRASEAWGASTSYLPPTSVLPRHPAAVLLHRTRRGTGVAVRRAAGDAGEVWVRDGDSGAASMSSASQILPATPRLIAF